jgi:hypothetical protein
VLVFGRLDILNCWYSDWPASSLLHMKLCWAWTEKVVVVREESNGGEKVAPAASVH